MTRIDNEIIDYLTAGDMHMLIVVLEALEESYNLDMQEGIDRSEDNHLIPWARRIRRILAMSIEKAGDRYRFHQE